MTKFRTLVADPAWLFGDSLPGGGRGAAKHYKCMKLKDIMNFMIPPMEDNSRLLLWRVAAMQQEALDVARAWGFNQKSEMVWVKMAGNGRLYTGMGHQVRNAHEVCLICTRGSPTRNDMKQRSVFFAPKPKQHSAKPDRFYRIVQRLYPGPYVELFARQQRPGWTCFGDEIDKAPYSLLLAALG